MDKFTRQQFRLLLAAFIEKEEVTVRKTAKVIGCSVATLTRILAIKSQPTDELMKQGALMFELGLQRYSRLTNAERSNLSERIGTLGAASVSFAVIPQAIAAAGISGISGVGITSGLATLGGLVGGGMVAGVSLLAAVPVAFGSLGYAIIKGVKFYVSERQLNSTELDPKWEMSV